MILALSTAAQYYWSALTARFRNEDGAVATEYGLLIALIALVIIGAVTALGLTIAGVFSNANDCISGGGAGC